ncbi:hypothetical protein ILYODFUR_029024 [Ilyodon furcidens]|uniref:Uncharacterized protein n=1 Tax=Ilyodon furcidens TaxID=33524 RepID=A0ABV0TPG8_9TELE
MLWYFRLEESLEFPRTVKFTGHLTWLAVRTDQCTAPAANPVHPSSKDYFPGFCRHRSLDQLSVLTRPLPGGYRRPISRHYLDLVYSFQVTITYLRSFPSQPSPAFMVARSLFLSLNKIIKTFFVPECSLHVGQVGNQDYDNCSDLHTSWWFQTSPEGQTLNWS